MSPVLYTFDRAQWREFKSPKDFALTIKTTQRFFRSSDSKLLFNVQPGTNDFVMLTRAAELRSALEDGDCNFFRIEHPRHELTQDDWVGFWHALSDNRWRLDVAHSWSMHGARTAVRA